jgi:hypothetical protein
MWSKHLQKSWIESEKRKLIDEEALRKEALIRRQEAIKLKDQKQREEFQEKKKIDDLAFQMFPLTRGQNLKKISDDFLFHPDLMNIILGYSSDPIRDPDMGIIIGQKCGDHKFGLHYIYLKCQYFRSNGNCGHENDKCLNLYAIANYDHPEGVEVLLFKYKKEFRHGTLHGLKLGVIKENDLVFDDFRRGLTNEKQYEWTWMLLGNLEESPFGQYLDNSELTEEVEEGEPAEVVFWFEG